MNTFKVNRNSWHYKLNKNFLNEDGHSINCMRSFWEPKHNNFCSYWRATVIRMIAATVIVAIIAGIVGLVSYAVITNPITTLIMAGVVAGTFTAVVSIYLLGSVAGKTIGKGIHKMEESDNLFLQKYRTNKAKICPNVEYDT